MMEMRSSASNGVSVRVSSSITLATGKKLAMETTSGAGKSDWKTSCVELRRHAEAVVGDDFVERPAQELRQLNGRSKQASIEGYPCKRVASDWRDAIGSEPVFGSQYERLPGAQRGAAGVSGRVPARPPSTRKEVDVLLLANDDIERRLAALGDWRREGDAIVRQFTFASFPDAMAFLVRLAFEAEAADHHPDVTINYRRVTLSYTTHDAGGLTAKDFDGARTADRLFAERRSGGE